MKKLRQLDVVHRLIQRAFDSPCDFRGADAAANC